MEYKKLFYFSDFHESYFLKKIYFSLNHVTLFNTKYQETTVLYHSFPPWVLEMDLYITLDVLASGKLSTNKRN